MDYGHGLLFGTFLTPQAESPRHVLELAQLTDELGLDPVTIQDHPYQARFLDMWTLLSVIAAGTVNVHVGPKRGEPTAATTRGTGAKCGHARHPERGSG